MFLVNTLVLVLSIEAFEARKTRASIQYLKVATTISATAGYLFALDPDNVI